MLSEAHHRPSVHLKRMKMPALPRGQQIMTAALRLRDADVAKLVA